MCNHCYHAYGRAKLASQCPHRDRLVYAKSMCISCYQKRKRAIRKQKLSDQQWPKEFKAIEMQPSKPTQQFDNEEQTFMDFLK